MPFFTKTRVWTRRCSYHFTTISKSKCKFKQNKWLRNPNSKRVRAIQNRKQLHPSYKSSNSKKLPNTHFTSHLLYSSQFSSKLMCKRRRNMQQRKSWKKVRLLRTWKSPFMTLWPSILSALKFTWNSSTFHYLWNGWVGESSMLLSKHLRTQFRSELICLRFT